MNRLTSKDKKGQNVIISDVWGYTTHGSKLTLYGDVTERLSAYEDTGLSPEEIKILQEDSAKFHKLIDDLEEIVTNKPKEHSGDDNDKVYCRDCDYLNMDSGKPFCCHSRMSTNGLDDWCNFGTKRQDEG
ncbi:MAG: hypothetical protein NC452_03995 [Eubacterium sp.]|nr:hypothetical protein [Eubacterium sp.]